MPKKLTLLEAAEKGDFSEYSTKELQQSLDIARKTTFMHIAIVHGHFNKIPKKLLISKNLRIMNQKGNTIFQTLAEFGLLKKLPSKVLTKNNLMIRNFDGNTTFHIAATHNWDQIPEKFITQEILELKGYLEQNLFHLAAQYNTFDKITLDLLTEQNLKLTDKWGRNSFNISIQHGNWDQVPENYITRKNMLLSDQWGENLYHIALNNNLFHKIPKEFITEKICAITDEKNRNLYHIAVIKPEGFKHFPTHTITEKGLKLKDRDGFTSFYIAAQRGELYLIPEKFLTKENLLEPNKNENPIIRQFKIGKVKHTPAVWKHADTITLTELKHYMKIQDWIEVIKAGSPGLKNVFHENRQKAEDFLAKQKQVQNSLKTINIIISPETKKHENNLFR
jgi:hypothetical protein